MAIIVIKLLRLMIFTLPNHQRQVHMLIMLGQLVDGGVPHGVIMIAQQAIVNIVLQRVLKHQIQVLII